LTEILPPKKAAFPSIAIGRSPPTTALVISSVAVCEQPAPPRASAAPREPRTKAKRAKLLAGVELGLMMDSMLV
jgi:hypothetical protein